MWQFPGLLLLVKAFLFFFAQFLQGRVLDTCQRHLKVAAGRDISGHRAWCSFWKCVNKLREGRELISVASLGCYYRTPWIGYLSMTEIWSSQFWRLPIPGFSVWWGPPPGDRLLTSCTRIWCKEGKRVLWGLFSKDTDLTSQGSTLMM